MVWTPFLHPSLGLQQEAHAEATNEDGPIGMLLSDFFGASAYLISLLAQHQQIQSLVIHDLL